MSATPSKKFTDERSSAVVRGEICNHGTQRIHREFQSFDPGVLPPAERLIYDHARALEDRGENVNIITLAKSLDDAGKLDLAGGAGTILPGDQIDEVVWAAVRSLVECHKRSKMAKIGTLLSEGTLDHVDAIRQLEVIASSSDNRRRSRIFQNSKLAAYKSAEDPNGLLGINGGWIRKGK
jgi:hypothetical protein